MSQCKYMYLQHPLTDISYLSIKITLQKINLNIGITTQIYLNVRISTLSKYRKVSIYTTVYHRRNYNTRHKLIQRVSESIATKR